MNNTHIDIHKTFVTSGTGPWTNKSKQVNITGLELGYVDDEGDFGELRVYFNTDTWNVEQDGLIYGDPVFFTMLQHLIREFGIGGFVDYSEQGLQGDNYVSFDIDGQFIADYTGRRWLTHLENVLKYT